ncbi:MAG: acyltransferase, partial [Gemmatimonadetes bacterium]|nr:acyltransferase [Gemmatimonadota bacterium]
MLVTDTKPHRIPALDGWRGIAIAMVVAAHTASPLYHAGVLPPEWVRVVYLGGHGVGLFFGLSGFLICTRLLDECRATGRVRLGEFYLRRAFRILPPALVYLAVVGVLGRLGVLPVDPREWWAALLLFRNYVPVFFPGGAGRYTGHFWSLAVEEHFYVLVPLLLAWGRTRGLGRVLAAAAVTVAVWRYFDLRHGWGARWLGLAPYTAEYRTDIRLDALLWGGALAVLLHDPRWRARAARLLRPAVWGCAAAVYAALVALSWPGHLWGALLVPALLAGTVLHPDARAARVLGWAPLGWLGRISYSLYLWHILFMPQMAE